MIGIAFQHVDLATPAEAMTAGVGRIDAGAQAGIEDRLPIRDFDGLSQRLYGQNVAHCVCPTALYLNGKSHVAGAAEDPLTPALSPRGEGVRPQPLRWPPLSPWGEGQGEGVFIAMHSFERRS